MLKKIIEDSKVNNFISYQRFGYTQRERSTKPVRHRLKEVWNVQCTNLIAQHENGRQRCIVSNSNVFVNQVQIESQYGKNIIETISVTNFILALEPYFCSAVENVVQFNDYFQPSSKSFNYISVYLKILFQASSLSLLRNYVHSAVGGKKSITTSFYA